MVERLKRWESPRKRGRNDKGKGGSARARQLRKREQMLRQKLKSNGSSKPAKSNQKGREIIPSLFCWQLNLPVWSQHYIIQNYDSKYSHLWVITLNKNTR